MPSAESVGSRRGREGTRHPRERRHPRETPARSRPKSSEGGGGGGALAFARPCRAQGGTDARDWVAGRAQGWPAHGAGGEGTAMVGDRHAGTPG